ncbi:16S rRNA (uracil(1498)-N(3))-methyltransferase [Sphingorhabdus sp. Alg239-R122]|uniref:16S rRNA (uracil(1498)-N(3))-methyltransferase n=1 Tax=Sphingorhabdus sp. Alg239-R122 TaxID=2305989 RepID=UPI0013DC312A|nr:16S rRNA (uracil(1498)-N(3))-methyltransferase [Sphingorhabdus sp. Alg239-R122]
MPATPAYPPHSAPRLFVDEVLSDGIELRLGGPQAHYLANVMRAKPGDAIVLFDNRTGEYLGQVTHAAKRAVTVLLTQKLREREIVPDLWLCAAPIKRARFDWMAEKACELGVRRFVPVRTQRTVVDKIKPDRLRAHMIEAAEQCERSSLPELGDLTKLADLLAEWPEGRHIFFADERIHASGEGSFRKALVAHDGPAAILIGPEGGFNDEEGNMIRAHPSAVPVSLGPRILRADTAAAAAVSLWMAGRGDWN